MSFIALLVSMMFIPTLLFTSCSNDQNLENEVKKSDSTQDLQIVINYDLFNKSISNLGASRVQNDFSDDNVWNIIKTSFQIVKDDETMSVLDYFALHNMNETKSKDLVLGKIFLFNNYDDTVISRANSELSLEEIRNAMMDECEYGYIDPITTACKAAVLIAYYYKKITE